MIAIDMVVDDEGILVSCGARGHAFAGPLGADLVCAAVSVLLRTAFRVLSNKNGIVVRGDAPDRGLLWLEVEYAPEGKDFLAAAGAFLTEGLLSVSGDYPEHCTVTIRTRRK